MRNDNHKPGSPEWWSSPAFGLQGPADTILRLLEQDEITRRKALELLEHLFFCQVSRPKLRREAPWEKLNWCDD